MKPTYTAQLSHEEALRIVRMEAELRGEPICSTCEVVETDCDCYDGKYERASRAL